ncbi:hypothetical protein ScPMuIL_003238 [Solemya velum]
MATTRKDAIFSLTLFILLTFRFHFVTAVDYCNISGSKEDCHAEPGVTAERCHDRGCCWRPTDGRNVTDPMCYRASVGAGGQCSVSDLRKADCHPEPAATPTACFARGCCWGASGVGRTAYCYYLANHTGFETTSIQDTPTGQLAYLRRSQPTHWPNEMTDLNLTVKMETSSRLRFKLTDTTRARYEVDISAPVVTSKASSTDYTVHINNSPAGVIVTRKSTGSILFDTTVSPLVYSDQFIQIRASIPTRYIYGFGEHLRQFWIDPSTSPTFSFWGRDQAPKPNANLYGTHPFFLGIEQDGNAFGVFLLNSNAMDVHVIPTTPVTLNYRTIGGILDFYIFTGPSPDDVIRQYSDVIGKTYFPPYWSLGFHLCRWGYTGSAEINTVINRMRSAQMPHDTQWVDIDYMSHHRDWTYNRTSFAGLPGIGRDLHNNGQRLVAMVDPGIGKVDPASSYAPYADGLSRDIFIKTNDRSQNIVGLVWPGESVFPDFTHPNIQGYWTTQNRLFHDQVSFDGIWIDMNEPASFVDGSTTGCTNSSLDNPPFTPEITDRSLKKKTLCPSAQHHSTSHYNLHNMYGYHQSRTTKGALDIILGKRSLVITRSSFPGTGSFAGHWTGDNSATWANMYDTIPGMLNFNMFGIPMVGSDICGFNGDAEEELCTRWMQLGAFYPFMRNHNHATAAEQDPASVRFSEHRDKMRSALLLRYTLLPYLYTLFYNSHMYGTPVIRPLFFQYPRDMNSYSIDKQFMWGQHMLISPVLTQGATSVNAYFPRDTWYDYYSGAKTNGGNIRLSAPIDKINVHIRGGAIIPTQQPDITTTRSRRNPFGLVVALPNSGSALGELFWDDGESYGTIGGRNNNYITFSATSHELRSTVVRGAYLGSPMTLGSIRVFGMLTSPPQVVLNGGVVGTDKYTYDTVNNVLIVSNLTQNLLEGFRIAWGTAVIIEGK